MLPSRPAVSHPLCRSSLDNRKPGSLTATRPPEGQPSRLAARSWERCIRLDRAGGEIECQRDENGKTASGLVLRMPEFRECFQRVPGTTSGGRESRDGRAPEPVARAQGVKTIGSSRRGWNLFPLA